MGWGYCCKTSLKFQHKAGDSGRSMFNSPLSAKLTHHYIQRITCVNKITCLQTQGLRDKNNRNIDNEGWGKFCDFNLWGEDGQRQQNNRGFTTAHPTLVLLVFFSRLWYGLVWCDMTWWDIGWLDTENQWKSAGNGQYCRLHRLSRRGCRPQVTSSVLGVLLAHDASVAHLHPSNYLTAAPGTKCIFSTKVHCNKEILINFMHFLRKEILTKTLINQIRSIQCGNSIRAGLLEAKPNFAKIPSTLVLSDLPTITAMLRFTFYKRIRSRGNNGCH